MNKRNRHIIDLRRRPASAPRSEPSPRPANAGADDKRAATPPPTRANAGANDERAAAPPPTRANAGADDDERAAAPPPTRANGERAAAPPPTRANGTRPEPKPPRAPAEPSPPVVGEGSFADLGLSAPLLRAVDTAGYTHPTPIQVEAIPPLLEGRDLLGIARTGTGKTAAFTLPILQRLAPSAGRRRTKRARVLVVTPTRELAIQIGESFATYGRYVRVKCAVIFGGVNQRPQVQTMASGVDVLVATPGRLLDLIGQGFVKLDAVEAFVLDEADRMLDMGFIHDVKRIIRELPRDRQTLLFSATMPQAIANLASSVMDKHVRVEVTPAASTVELVSQSVMFVERGHKKDLLAEIFDDDDVARALVFSRTKRGANRIARFLDQIGVAAAPIHGNKTQGARQRALAAFHEGRIRALVATDIAARGIDVEQITHVINFDLPNEPESYVHRIGRTARAGHEGVALSFCMRDELDYLRAIERLIRQSVPVATHQPFHSDEIADDYRNGKRGSVKQGDRRGSGGSAARHDTRGSSRRPRRGRTTGRGGLRTARS